MIVVRAHKYIIQIWDKFVLFSQMIINRHWSVRVENIHLHPCPEMSDAGIHLREIIFKKKKIIIKMYNHTLHQCKKLLIV